MVESWRVEFETEEGVSLGSFQVYGDDPGQIVHEPISRVVSFDPVDPDSNLGRLLSHVAEALKLSRCMDCR